MKSLIFDQVTFAYNLSNPVFDEISLALRNPKENEGYIIALMGASGTGKSTFLKLIMRLLMPQKGKITSNPANPVISYVPQEAVLFDHLSPMENARYFARLANYHKSFDQNLFEQLCDVLDMNKVLSSSKKVSELSGGQRQRLNLIRALSIKPDFLLLDEPTTGLDSEVKLQLMHKIREIVLQQKILAIYISHHKVETEILADEIIYMDSHQNGSNKIHQKDLKNFIACPPFLTAANVFNYPKPNVLRCKINSDGTIEPTTKDLDDCVFLVIKAENISFSTQEGFTFNLINENPIHSFIEIFDHQLFTIDSFKLPNAEGNRLLLNGEMLMYAADGGFLRKIQINNNKKEQQFLL